MIRARSIYKLAILVVPIAAIIALVWPAMAQSAQPLGDTPATANTATNASEAFAPVWLLTLVPTDLWSGPHSEATRFGPVPVGTPLKMLAPQEYGRLLVLNPRTENIAWVDATAVGPISEPTPEQLAVLLAPPPFEPWWAMTHLPALAWSGVDEDAVATGRIPQWRYLRVIQPEESGRVLTVDPRTEATAYVELDALGPVGPPPEDYFAAPPPDTQTLALPARIVGSPDSYERPERADYFSLRRLSHNQPITVQALVEQGEAGRWYRIDQAEYVPSGNVRVPALPQRTFPGRWIDANLNEPVLVTAYEGERPVYAALAVKGTAAFQTPIGVHRILRRVANETMDSATIGIPRNSPNGYYLRDVLYTQYFTNDGAALHYNYWRSDFGYAGSKGCLGMNLADSQFFWDFASVGTMVYIHY